MIYFNVAWVGLGGEVALCFQSGAAYMFYLVQTRKITVILYSPVAFISEKFRCQIQGGSTVKKVRTFIKEEVAQASIILTFQIINKGRKVAQASIIFILKKVKGS